MNQDLEYFPEKDRCLLCLTVLYLRRQGLRQENKVKFSILGKKLKVYNRFDKIILYSYDLGNKKIVVPDAKSITQVMV